MTKFIKELLEKLGLEATTMVTAQELIKNKINDLIIDNDGKQRIIESREKKFEESNEEAK